MYLYPAWIAIEEKPFLWCINSQKDSLFSGYYLYWPCFCLHTIVYSQINTTISIRASEFTKMSQSTTNLKKTSGHKKTQKHHINKRSVINSNCRIFKLTIIFFLSIIAPRVMVTCPIGPARELVDNLRLGFLLDIPNRLLHLPIEQWPSPYKRFFRISSMGFRRISGKRTFPSTANGLASSPSFYVWR